MIMSETVRLRLVFEDRHMLSKSMRREGLKRSWVLLKPHLDTISDLASHLFSSFRLHRTCLDGIILSMDGFVLPPFESASILKNEDIVCVNSKGSTPTDYKAAMLTSASHGHQCVGLPKLLANEKFQEETEGYKTEAQEDNNDRIEDAFHVESISDGDEVSKKRKASKKLKGSRHKKIKLSPTKKLSVIPEARVEENGSFQGYGIHNQLSLVKKNIDKPSNLSRQPDKSSILDIHKQSKEINGSFSNETRFCWPQDDGKGIIDVSGPLDRTKKLPSRSARRKKAKRQWLREQVKLEKEKLHQSAMCENDGQHVPVKNNNHITSDVHQEPDEGSDAEDDIVPVEIRPGHIRFEPLKKDQGAVKNQLPVETFQWNGITCKKKGQKWGKEKIPFHKRDDCKHSNQECTQIPNAEEKDAFISVDFDKLTPYTNLPKEGDVIAYRLIELSASWTPELSSFRVGKISRYDPESNRISLVPVLEYPFEFEKKIDEESSSAWSDPSPYGEDGSLEIDFSSLAEMRLVKHGNPDSSNVVDLGEALVDLTKATNGRISEEPVSDQTAVESCKPHNGREVHIPAKENGEVNVWDEINEALTAKKARLSEEDGWSKEESSGSRSWSRRALSCSALGPTIAFLRAQNGL